MPSCGKRLEPIAPRGTVQKGRRGRLKGYGLDNDSIVPTLWHPEKGKTMEIIKRTMVASGCKGGRDEQAEHRGFSGQRNYSVCYYNNATMTLNKYMLKYWLCAREWSDRPHPRPWGAESLTEKTANKQEIAMRMMNRMTDNINVLVAHWHHLYHPLVQNLSSDS